MTREETWLKLFHLGVVKGEMPDSPWDLRETDLSEANLSEADLRETDLSRADLSEANLCGAILNGADLSGAILNGANFSEANLSRANLNEAKLIEANLRETDLSEANLRRAILFEADLRGAILQDASLIEADLRGANLSKSNLLGAVMVKTDLHKTTLSECYIYGISSWDVKTDKTTIQKDLIITSDHDSKITVDDIEVAQLIYLLLNNKKIKNMIDSMKTRAVLILGSFDDTSMIVLETLKSVIRKHKYIPLLLDFEKPKKQELMETVRTLALLSNFVIVDPSVRSGQLHELVKLVQDTYIPIITIAHKGTKVTTMHGEFRHYYWYRKEYFKYSYETVKQEIPQLFIKDIIPWVNQTNNRIKEESK